MWVGQPAGPACSFFILLLVPTLFSQNLRSCNRHMYCCLICLCIIFSYTYSEPIWLQQSKVKQVAGVVKSCIDPNYGSNALGALQELEALAGGDANALSHGQA